MNCPKKDCINKDMLCDKCVDYDRFVSIEKSKDNYLKNKQSGESPYDGDA